MKDLARPRHQFVIPTEGRNLLSSHTGDKIWFSTVFHRPKSHSCDEQPLLKQNGKRTLALCARTKSRASARLRTSQESLRLTPYSAVFYVQVLMVQYFADRKSISQDRNSNKTNILAAAVSKNVVDEYLEISLLVSRTRSFGQAWRERSRFLPLVGMTTRRGS